MFWLGVVLDGVKMLLSRILMTKKDREAVVLSRRIRRRAKAKARTTDEVPNIERELRHKARRDTGIVWGAMSEGNDPDQDDVEIP